MMGGGGGQISCPGHWYSFLLAVLTKLYYSVHTDNYCMLVVLLYILLCKQIPTQYVYMYTHGK